MSSFKMSKLVFQKMKKGLSLRVVNRMIFLLAIVFFAAYLFEVNSLSVKGFELGKINKDINDLNANNTELELKIMHLESYARVNERVGRLGLVKVDKVDYITPSIGVAMK